MLNFKKEIRTKLKIINEYWNQIEYKKLALTRDIILAWHVNFFFKLKKFNLKKIKITKWHVAWYELDTCTFF